MTGKTLERMTDAELAREHGVSTDVITSAVFWGDDVTVAQARRREIEAEQFRRRVAQLRAETIHINPIVCDSPPPRYAAPVITGTAKSRSAARWPRLGLIGSLGFLIACLAVSFVMAGQRLIELEDRYAAMERV